MQSVLLIDHLSRADVLIRPGRAELLRRLVEPRTCSQIANELASTPQRVYYHVKALEGAGLATKVFETQVRGLREDGCCAAAGCFLGPHVHMEACGDYFYNSDLPCGLQVVSGGAWVYAFDM